MPVIPNLLFSVIIPNYNMGRFIGEALQSIDAQSCSNWEIIVVDDCGPDDGTESLVRRFAGAHQSNRVKFIRHTTNTGVSGARNTAIQEARGEFLAFLDPDDIWLPNYLSRYLKILNSDQTLDAISSPTIKFWDDAGKIVRTVKNPLEDWQISNFPSSLGVSNFIQPSSTVIRRSLVTKIGGFDVTPNLQHIEDYDLWIRAVQAGAKFKFINSYLTKYRKHSSAATAHDDKMDRLHENLIQKHQNFFFASQRKMLTFLMSNTKMKRQKKASRIVTFCHRVVRKLKKMIS
jgi:teichuronic acid biosynthesis glycosyltransferase TuaG